jgi:hypothetical protein
MATKKLTQRKKKRLTIGAPRYVALENGGQAIARVRRDGSYGLLDGLKIDQHHQHGQKSQHLEKR